MESLIYLVYFFILATVWRFVAWKAKAKYSNFKAGFLGALSGVLVSGVFLEGIQPKETGEYGIGSVIGLFIFLSITIWAWMATTKIKKSSSESEESHPVNFQALYEAEKIKREQLEGKVSEYSRDYDAMRARAFNAEKASSNIKIQSFREETPRRYNEPRASSSFYKTFKEWSGDDLTFTYKTLDGRVEDRTVTLKDVERSGKFIAYCHLRSAIRTFHANGIIGEVVNESTGETWEEA